jgi:hypothetical protein
LAHHDNTAALAAAVLAQTAIDPLDPVIVRPDMTAEAGPVDLHHAAQGCRHSAREQGASELVKQDKGGLGVNVEVPAHLQAADALGGVDEQTERQKQHPEGKLA